MNQLNPSLVVPNGPGLWDLILERMPPGAVVAGGAVRDFLLGVDPKDIDVFTGPAPAEPVSPNPARWELKMLPDARCGLGRIDSIFERQEEYSAVSNIVLVSQGELYGHRVDLIEMHGFAGGDWLIPQFDFGITRCWYDGQIHDTGVAKADREGKSVTLLLTDRLERARKRFKRFNERMGGDWVLIEPVGLKQ